MKRIALVSVRVYQQGLSPFIPGVCRHYPSCSQYSYEAIAQHGASRGIWLTLKRLARCHPWGTRGYDPVP